jgi:hypothetical protein
MTSELLPRWQSPSPTPPLDGHPFRRCSVLVRARNGLFRTLIFSACILIGLIGYMTLLTPQGSLLTTPLDWYSLCKADPNYPESMQTEPSSFTHITHPLPSPTSADIPQTELPPPFPALDELTLEQIRDIVAPTRGFYSRDYSLYLGWNNVSVHGIASAK